MNLVRDEVRLGLQCWLNETLHYYRWKYRRVVFFGLTRYLYRISDIARFCKRSFLLDLDYDKREV